MTAGIGYRYNSPPLPELFTGSDDTIWSQKKALTDLMIHNNSLKEL